MIGPPEVYAAAAKTHDQPLRQGEILSGLVQLLVDLASLASSESLLISRREHPFAILLTQDCDLAQDFEARKSNSAPNRVIPSALFCEVVAAQELRGADGMNSKLWERIRKNDHDRFHFLQKIEPAYDAEGQGLQELGLDFKRYFTLPIDEVYERVKMQEARRRTVLLSPYLEHCARRFANFLSRIALPADHTSE